ncbi:MAG: FAD-dependent oxidoreductase, partial [Candidatus Bilamarchaeaceae archaeon]
MKAALSLKSEGYLHQLYFYYPLRGGYQAIPNAITKNIKNRLKTSFEVKEIRKEEDFVVYGKRKEIKTYKKIVSTIHILDFLKLYRGTPSDVLRAAKKLHWNSAYLVMIGIKKPKINNMHWLYIPDENILANRISFPHNYSPYVTPRNHSSILAEITYSSSQKIAKEEPEKIKNRVIEELSSLKFFNKNEVVFSKIINVPYAYVVYTLDYEENINKIYNFVCEEGVTLLGRFSEFKYYNADKCIERAMETAKMFKK